ncbi:MAG: NAD(P)H-dependent oxidoreductase subunit E [Clostridia bacterium]|nr:NAD(P)H-dependent oxidoreductase subunit E [Clostridia bacterium]MBO7156535.1 NAD(P)H-dependent oxidoreductase subunit E [Clostridia bacterium]
MARIKISKVPFAGTPEQEKALDAKLAELKSVPGGLMPALQFAQELYGYLPIEVQTKIAEALDVSLEEVFGVATFYSQFTLSPRGKFQVAVCMGTACYVKGAGDLVDALKVKLGIESGECTDDGKFSLVETRCIGCCGLAPVMTVNANVYGKVTTNQLDGIMAEYK